MKPSATQRDELWPCVNAPNGVIVAQRWDRVAGGSVGTLRQFGHVYAVVEFDDYQNAPLAAQVPIILLRPSDELAARRYRRQQHGWLS